ncbi:polysaccharide deacetylase family protein [Maricaulis sp. D1M11]|uniref:polysaccharide deacetylase family protein n=1 Tax=Maricaulis sp. D1M11 TaxID=3076117 RepID=UPI0039B3BF38
MVKPMTRALAPLWLGVMALLNASLAWAEDVPAVSADPCTARMGTARTIELDVRGGAEIGTMQYTDTLDLAPGEIVFTFDDGPSPDYTLEILDTLDTHCVKAVFFLVGLYADRHPELVREIWSRGHTVANHTWSHQLLHRVGPVTGGREVERGFDAINAALLGLQTEVGEPAQSAPFFRFPGLNHTRHLRTQLAGDDIAVISCDIGTDDWRRISSDSVYQRALRNIESRGSGVVIMHDTHARTATALPRLLDTLAERGYRAVHLTASSHSSTLSHTTQITTQADTDQPHGGEE